MQFGGIEDGVVVERLHSLAEEELIVFRAVREGRDQVVEIQRQRRISVIGRRVGPQGAILQVRIFEYAKQVHGEEIRLRDIVFEEAERSIKRNVIFVRQNGGSDGGICGHLGPQDVAQRLGHVGDYGVLTHFPFILFPPLKISWASLRVPGLSRYNEGPDSDWISSIRSSLIKTRRATAVSSTVRSI